MVEKELLKRVASVLSPFPPSTDGVEVWHDIAQTFITVYSLNELKEYISEWVIEVCKSGKWQKGFYYEVPKGAVDFAVFFGNITVDYYRFYIKTFMEIKELSDYLNKTVDVFVPSQKITVFYPLTILVKGTYVQLNDVDIDEQTIITLNNNKHLLERLFSTYKEFDAKRFDSVACEVLTEAKNLDEKLWYALSIISAKMYIFVKRYESLPFY